MHPYSTDTHSLPTINVNLKSCTYFGVCNVRGDHIPECAAVPIPIPLSLQPFRSVTFTVRLGECSCANDPDDTVHAPPPGKHLSSCPARPIRVTCSISGKTWETSRTHDEHDIATGAWVTGDALRICRERWALVKALVLGRCTCGKSRIVNGCWEHQTTCAMHRLQCTCGGAYANHPDGEHDGHCPAALLAQRDAVYAALADMARAEEAHAAATQRLESALPSSVRWGPSGASTRDSERRLAAYVEHLVEQVGVLEVAP